jgi:hypothetical protein
MADAMLTTVDNPYNPFDDFAEWFAFDSRMGYHTPSLLARVAVTSDELSEEDQNFAIQEAIEEIVKENVSGMHRKVSREDFETKNSVEQVEA